LRHHIVGALTVIAVAGVVWLIATRPEIVAGCVGAFLAFVIVAMIYSAGYGISQDWRR
jgi:hypothetical protein